MYDLDGKVALVTGCARPRSIGRAIALRLAQEGCDVAALDIGRRYDELPDYAQLATAGELEETAALVRDRGRRAVTVHADVSVETEVEAAVAAALDELGRIDIVVNAAGGAGIGMGTAPLIALPEQQWSKLVDVNLKGSWLVSRAAARDMVARGDGGRIICIASQAAKTGFPLLGAYCAAKAGVLGMVRAWALELAGSAVTVNAVCPGTVDTDLTNKDGMLGQMLAMQSGKTPEAALADFVRREIPLGRLETPADVAGVVAFLASDQAGYMTGQAINVTGGQEMH
ncbi:MAG: SDR family oxidoreductase [Acidimicrobiia bacterium]|nr:SDR family oxidoreductase [Acidimicrobiia bacterium]